MKTGIWALFYIATSIFAFVPNTSFAQELIKIQGIEVPVSKFKAKRGGKPSRPTYYGYHFKPISKQPSPYLINITSSTTKLIGSGWPQWRQAVEAQKRGYGVILIDINRGVTGSKDYNGLVKAPPRAIGALSFLEHVTTKYPGYSNGKFGAFGHSKGGSTAIEINKAELREGAFVYRNVKYWFDAVFASAPTCGRNDLVKPTLIVIGEDDNWTSPANCRSMETALGMENVRVVYLENADHGYLDPSNGKGIMHPRGFKLTYNAKALKKAQNEMFAFFDE